jgi:hypothetical protein
MKSKNEDTIKIEGFRKIILRSNADKLVYVHNGFEAPLTTYPEGIYIRIG